METRGVREGDQWHITGAKMWNTGLHVANARFRFHAHQRQGRQPARHHLFHRADEKTRGFKIEEYMVDLQHAPTDHPRVSIDVRISGGARCSPRRSRRTVSRSRNTSWHENRIRQAASSLGAAQYCVNESVKYAKERKPFGKPLAVNQAIQWPLVELHTECAMLRELISQDRMGDGSDAEGRRWRGVSPTKLRMCNYRANRLVCNAADRAMQVHGANRYSRHKPFEAHLPDIAVIASPKARRKSRCGASRRSCSASPAAAVNPKKMR